MFRQSQTKRSSTPSTNEYREPESIPSIMANACALPRVTQNQNKYNQNKDWFQYNFHQRMRSQSFEYLKFWVFPEIFVQLKTAKPKIMTFMYQDEEQGSSQKCSQKNAEKQQEQKKKKDSKTNENNPSSEDNTKKKEEKENLNLTQQKIQAMKTIFHKQVGSEFFDDAVYLEAFYYQLTKLGLSRTPLSSSPPIIAYYLFVLLIHNKITTYLSIEQFSTKLLTSDTEMKKIISKIEEDPFLVKTLCDALIKQLPKDDQVPQKNIDLAFYVYFKAYAEEFNSFNEDVIINDFMLYRQLYLERKEEIFEKYKKDLLQKNNICIAFIRFYLNIKQQEIFFRFPLGNFQNQAFIDCEEMIKQQQVDETFTEGWFKNYSANHSEKGIVLWIVMDMQTNKTILNLLKKELCREKGNIELLKVSIEITTEKRMCSQCVDMVAHFPSGYVGDFVVKELSHQDNYDIKLSDQFHVIIASQYFNDPGYCKLQNPEFVYQQNDNSLKFFAMRYNIDCSIKQRMIYYFEFGQTGILSERFLQLRYKSNRQQTIINSPIPSIKLTNSIFLSCDKLDNSKSQENSQQSDDIEVRPSISSSQSVQQVPQYNLQQFQQHQSSVDEKETSKQSKFSNRLYSIFYSYRGELKSVFNSLNQVQFIQNAESENHFCVDFEQIQMEQSFSLFIILAQKELNDKKFYIPSEIHQKVLMQIVEYLIYQKQDDDWYYSSEFTSLMDSFQSNSLVVENIFESRNINTELLIRDFRFLSKSQDVRKSKQKSIQPINFNYGIIQFILRSNTQSKVFNSDFMQEDEQRIFSCSLLGSCFVSSIKNLVTNWKFGLIEEVIIIITTSKQLEEHCKRYLIQTIKKMYTINLNFHFNFIRKLQENISENGLEKQFSFYDPKIIMARYSVMSHPEISFTSINDRKIKPIIFNCQEEHFQISIPKGEEKIEKPE